MEWIKKHWGIIAAIAVGIPMLYYLYQSYSTNQANAATNAQNTALQNAEAAATADYAQEVALANLGGGGVSSPSAVESTPQASPTTVPVVGSSPVAATATPVSLSTPPSSSSGGPPPVTYYSNTPSGAINPDYGATSVASTLLGGGNSAANSEPNPVGILSTIAPTASPLESNGSIPQNSIQISSPTHVELNTVGTTPGLTGYSVLA